MGALVEHVIQFIVHLGALGVFTASALEEIIVPIPSTVVQTGAGFLFLSGAPVTAHSIWILLAHVALPSAVGATVGSLLIYGLVYWGGLPFVRKFGKYFFLSESKLVKAHEAVSARKSLLWAFCFLRFIPILPNSVVTAGAGLIRLPLNKYLLTSFVGIFIRAAYLGAIGWATGGAFKSVDHQGSIFGMFLSLGLAVVAISAVTGGILLYAKRKKN